MDAPPAKKPKGENPEPTVIRLRVENPDKIDYADSPEVIIGGFPFILRVRHMAVINGTSYLRALAATSIESIATAYVCEYAMTVKLINQADASKTQQSSITGRFDSSGSPKEHCTPFSQTLACDPEKGFIKDNAIHFEASITIKKCSMKERKQMDFLSPSELFDVTFIIEGTKVYASRKLLASQSDVFMGMFFNGFKESDEAAEIPIPDVKLKDFINALNFLYRSGKDIEESNFEGLLAVSDKYNITSIIDAVEKYLLLDRQHLVCLSRKMLVSDEYRLKHLQEQMFFYLDACNKIEVLKKSSEFEQLTDKTKVLLFNKYIDLAQAERAKRAREEESARRNGMDDRLGRLLAERFSSRP